MRPVATALGALVAIVVVSATALKPAVAQPSASKLTPAQALSKVEDTYAKATAVSGAFAQTVVNQAYGTTTTSSGTFEVSRPDKLRFDYLKGKKLDRAFIFDGKTLWIDTPKNLEVMKQAATGSSLPAALAFLGAKGALAKDFTIAAPASPNNLVPGAIVLELTPKQPSASYASVRLVLDPTTWTVTRSIVTAPSGDTQTFELTKVDLAAKLDAKRFTFVVADHKNYKVTTP